MSDSGAPASTSAADDGQRPRRRVRMGEGRGVHHDARHQLGGHRPVVEVERRPEPGREQRDHLARRGAGRLDPVGVAGGAVGGVVIDDDPRQPLEQLRVALGDRADAVERTAVADDEQVVVDRRIGVQSGRARRRAGSRRAAGPGP